MWALEAGDVSLLNHTQYIFIYSAARVFNKLISVQFSSFHLYSLLA